MTFPRLHGALLLSIVFALAGAACKGGGASTETTSSSGGGASLGDASTGSDDRTKADGVATPQVIFDGQLANGSGSNCTEGALFIVGDFGDASSGTPSKPVKHGETFDDGVVSLTCSVVASGADYQVKGTIALSGPNGGAFEIDGSFASDAESTGIEVVASRADGSTFSSSSCRARYASAFQGVAAGRVWAEISCPAVESEDGSQSCDVVAQVRLENCAQE